MAAMASQSLMNLVDAAMVGSLGGEALAGVGLGGYASFIAISMVIGLGAGVQAMVARLLSLSRAPAQDAADALAAAIARAQMGRLAGLGVGRRRTRRQLVPGAPR